MLGWISYGASIAIVGLVFGAAFYIENRLLRLGICAVSILLLLYIGRLERESILSGTVVATKRNQKLQSELDTVNTALDRVQQKESEQSSKIDDLKSQNEELHSELDTANSTLDRFQQVVAKQSRKIDGLRSQNEELVTTIEKVRIQNVELSKDLVAARKELATAIEEGQIRTQTAIDEQGRAARDAAAQAERSRLRIERGKAICAGNGRNSVRYGIEGGTCCGSRWLPENEVCVFTN